MQKNKKSEQPKIKHSGQTCYKKKVDNPTLHQTFPVNKEIVSKILSERFKIDKFNMVKENNGKLQFSTTKDMQPKVDHIKKKLLALDVIKNRDEACCDNHASKFEKYSYSQTNELFSTRHKILKQRLIKHQEAQNEKNEIEKGLLESQIVATGLNNILNKCLEDKTKQKENVENKSFLNSSLVQRAINSYMETKLKESLYNTDQEKAMEEKAQDLVYISNSLGHNQSICDKKDFDNLENQSNIFDEDQLTDEKRSFLQNLPTKQQSKAFVAMLYTNKLAKKEKQLLNADKKSKLNDELKTPLLNFGKRALKTETDDISGFDKSTINNNSGFYNLPGIKSDTKLVNYKPHYENKESFSKNKSELFEKNNSFRINNNKRQRQNLSKDSMNVDLPKKLNDIYKMNRMASMAKINHNKSYNIGKKPLLNKFMSRMDKNSNMDFSLRVSDSHYLIKKISDRKIQNEDIHLKQAQLSNKSNDRYFKTRKFEEIHFSNKDTRADYYSTINVFDKFYDKYNEQFPDAPENEVQNSNDYQKTELITNQKSVDNILDTNSDNVRIQGYDLCNSINENVYLKNYKDPNNLSNIENNVRESELLTTMNDWFETKNDYDTDKHLLQEKRHNNGLKKGNKVKKTTDKDLFCKTLQCVDYLDEKQMEVLNQTQNTNNNQWKGNLKLIVHENDVMNKKNYIKDLQISQIDNNGKLFNIRDKFKEINDKIVQSELKRISSNYTSMRENTLKSLKEKVNPLKISSTTRHLKFTKHIENPDSNDRYIYDEHFRPEFIKTKRY